MKKAECKNCKRQIFVETYSDGSTQWEHTTPVDDDPRVCCISEKTNKWAEPKVKTGDIVLPSDSGTEVIVGIVLDQRFQKGQHLVMWLSDQRGAFTCDESENDLVVAMLSHRNADMTDYKVNPTELAILVARAL